MKFEFIKEKMCFVWNVMLGFRSLLPRKFYIFVVVSSGWICNFFFASHLILYFAYDTLKIFVSFPSIKIRLFYKY